LQKTEFGEPLNAISADVHGFGILEAIYFATFPEEAEQGNNSSASNSALDAETVKIDDRNATDAEIRRLGKLSLVEYERERKPAAEKLGISRVSVLDAAVTKPRMVTQADRDASHRLQKLSRGQSR
jgi:hypothetical protein